MTTLEEEESEANARGQLIRIGDPAAFLLLVELDSRVLIWLSSLLFSSRAFSLVLFRVFYLYSIPDSSYFFAFYSFS